MSIQLDEFYAISSRRSRDYLRALPFKKKRSFASIFPNASPLAVDFLARTLTFDPKKRITVEDALAHPYLSAYHDPDDEPSATPLPEDFFSFDRAFPSLVDSLAVTDFSSVVLKDEITREELKQLLYAEVCDFVPLA